MSKRGEDQEQKYLFQTLLTVQTLQVQAVAGYDIVTIPSNENGLVDLEELKKHVRSVIQLH